MIRVTRRHPVVTLKWRLKLQTVSSYVPSDALSACTFTCKTFMNTSPTWLVSCPQWWLSCPSKCFTRTSWSTFYAQKVICDLHLLEYSFIWHIYPECVCHLCGSQRHRLWAQVEGFHHCFPSTVCTSCLMCTSFFNAIHFTCAIVCHLFRSVLCLDSCLCALMCDEQCCFVREVILCEGLCDCHLLYLHALIRELHLCNSHTDAVVQW